MWVSLTLLLLWKLILFIIEYSFYFVVGKVAQIHVLQWTHIGFSHSSCFICVPKYQMENAQHNIQCFNNYIIPFVYILNIKHISRPHVFTGFPTLKHSFADNNFVNKYNFFVLHQLAHMCFMLVMCWSMHILCVLCDCFHILYK